MSESVQLISITRSSRKRRKPSVELALAQRLPEEILLHIFNLVPRVRAKPSSYITGQVDPMRHIPRVCKAWFNPATEVLYKFVCVPRVNSAMLFYRTMASQVHPHSQLGFLKERRKKKKKEDQKADVSGLGSLVKILLLPKRVFPHRLPTYPLPIPIGKHRGLKSLALANAEASLWTNFPLFSDQFPNLEELCLSGFRISTLIEATEVKPLLQLRYVRLESCDIGRLESWLIQCPKLRRLEIDLSVWNVPADGGIFSKDTLTRLQWSRTSTPIDLKHITSCKHLRTFTTDYHSFRTQWRFIPRRVHHLYIIFREADEPTKAVFTAFMEDSELVALGSLERLTVRIAKANPWIAENVEWLKALTKEKKVKLDLDLTKFGPLPVKPAVTLWQGGAQKIRRFTKPERASELDWEQQHAGPKKGFSEYAGPRNEKSGKSGADEPWRRSHSICKYSKYQREIICAFLEEDPVGQDKSSDANQSSPSSSGLGSLSVPTIAGLVAAAFALFVLGTWIVVILLRRRKRRRRRSASLPGRHRDKLPDEETEQKRKSPKNAEPNGLHSSENTEPLKSTYRSVGSVGEDYKFDPASELPPTETKGSDPSAFPQSIVLASFPTPNANSPFSAQSSTWNSPSSSSPLYTSSPSGTKTLTTPPIRQSSSRNNLLNTTAPAGPSLPGRSPVGVRTPSQLSKSFSFIDVQEAADMPEPEPSQPFARSKSNSTKPRKLEKRRRSSSLRRDSRSSQDAPGGRISHDKEKEKVPRVPQLQANTSSFIVPSSDSDQSSKTVLPPRRSKEANTVATPPSAFTSPGPSLTRQRSGIRQPGDPNHLRPPKEVTHTSEGSGSTMRLLSQAASSSDQSHGTIVPLLHTTLSKSQLQPFSTSPLPPDSTNISPQGRLQLFPNQWSTQQGFPSTSQNPNADNEVLAYHKAAGNVPKPFKPFAFQFPMRSPAVSNASNGRSIGNLNAEASVPPPPNSSNGFAALVAAAGLSMSPAGSPSPSPVGRSVTPGSNWIARGSTDGLGASMRPSTDGLTAFPPRSSTDALSNFAFGGAQESRQSLQSRYSLEVPFENQEGAASSPSAFSFSTDLYGYGGPGPASTSNSIDLYRRVDPTTLFPSGAPNATGMIAADMEGRHSLSLLGGEPLSPAELESRGLRMRRFREGHASVSSFAPFAVPDESRSTRTPSWTLEALRENLFGPAHRRGQESVASSSVGSQSRRSSMLPWLGVAAFGPPAMASPRDANFQFAVGPTGPSGLSHPYTPWSQQAGPSNLVNSPTEIVPSTSEPKMKTVVRTFAPLLPDELVLRPGEELAVLQEFDDGWCVVAREGLGSNGEPAPPGLDVDDVSSPVVGGDASSATGSSSSSRKRVLEMGTCPCWVFEENLPPEGEFTRPMRSTSLSVTVSMRVPQGPGSHSGSGSAMNGSGRGSPTSSHLRLGSYGPAHAGDSPSVYNRPPRTPIRDEVISWSNF
ncbi:hypothetical protein CPB86DRAFT_792962 [Serendipita vermifera]|nr:hypothetical protein CPB86DRAFT_792962 [Serendipita vermifera]